MQVQKLFYLIGVYDPALDESWPWHCHYEHGRYLSMKRRVCGQERAAQFSTEHEARGFFFSWKHWRKHKFELIPVQMWATEPDPVYPPDHPRSIFASIRANEPHPVRLTATYWFFGADLVDVYKPKTLAKHRAALLKYGIDIGKPRPDHFLIVPEPPVISEFKKIKFSVVK
jgi:hypothetical protein